MVSRAINGVPAVNPQLAKRVWSSVQPKDSRDRPAGSTTVADLSKGLENSVNARPAFSE
jgi:hypothetical protein